MTKKPTPKKAAKRKLKPRTTAVADRSSWPLGSEAKMLASFLRNVGADGARAVPPGSSDEARKAWLAKQSRFVKRLPMWMLDYAVAVLEQIPNREDRRHGRRREISTEEVERLSAFMPTAEAAKLVAETEAYLAGANGERLSADAIAERAEKLARRIYRQRKVDVPKSK